MSEQNANPTGEEQPNIFSERGMLQILVKGDKRLRAELEQDLEQARRQTPVPDALISSLEMEIARCKRNEDQNKKEIMKSIFDEVDAPSLERDEGGHQPQ